MTTTVYVKHEGDDDHDLAVTVVDTHSNALDKTIRLRAGESTTVHLHGMQSVCVREVAKTDNTGE